MAGKIIITLGLGFLALCFVGQVKAGCAEKNLCCEGQNNTCVSWGLNQRGNDGICYCDNACSNTQDCCDDFQKYCIAQDCVLGDWKKWGPCNKRCGDGVRSRVRPIIKKPKFGGKECEKVREDQPCSGSLCKQTRDFGPVVTRESGRIIPARFGKWRSSKVYDISSDIRKNLYFHYHAPKARRGPYCATYEILSSRKSCLRKGFVTWPSQLEKGAEICVECQPTAMHRYLGMRCRGHGSLGKPSRWNAVGISGCHGFWRMKTDPQDCTCKPANDDSFIFV